MNKNFLLSIDPSLSDTGFTLWRKLILKEKKPNEEAKMKIKWEPIDFINYNFRKYNDGNFIEKIGHRIINIIGDVYKSQYGSYHLEDLQIFIERGFYNQNKITSEILDNLRGNIFGLFFQIYKPFNNGINPKTWQSWYLKIFKYTKETKWDKERSLFIANNIIESNKWNMPKITNHNIADSLLIGWYVINNRKDINNE